MVVAILAAAIAFSGYVENLIYARHSLKSARAFLRCNSESIIQGVGQLMMSGNNEDVEGLVAEISQDSKVYRELRLVSHHSGEVVAARADGKSRNLQLEDPTCAVCHDQDHLGDTHAKMVDMVTDLPKGGRVLSVMAPIVNEPRCSSAACHAHADSPPMIGFLNADYSLERVDALATERRLLIIATVLAALLLGMVALRVMFTRLLQRPINGLIEGTKRVAANQLDFRFDQKRNDEIGVLEESFNAMTARIEAHRNELRSAMEYVGGIVENSADIIITVTPDGFIETFNRGAEETLGYGRVELIGKRIESLFADPGERDVAISRLKNTDNVKNYETRFLAKDGQVRNVLLTLSRLRDRDGNSIGTIGISKDITSEKKLQDELRDAKQYLEGMVEHSADIIITVNSEGLIETFNRGGEEALGYARGEVIGRRIESLYADSGERHAAAARLERTGNVRNYETRLLTKDGRVRNVLLTLSRLRDRDGNPIGTIGISKDITSEKKLQDELRDAKQYLEGMVEHSADIIITVNSEGLIETFNRGGEEALGHRREEVIGCRIESLYVDPRERHAAAAHLERTGNVRNYETRLLAKDGRVRNVLLTLSRLRDRDGNPIGTIGISKDITQEKKLQRELIQSQKFAAIGEAVTGIQHAIKNMLNALKGGAYLVRNGMAKDNRQRIEEGWEMVEEGIERINSLSRNMLDYAREWRLDPQRVDLSDLITQVCELNRPAAAGQGVALRSEVPDGLPAVLCDPKLIHQAATDIVVNAIDACTWKDYADGETPEVVVKNLLADKAGFFVIEIRDNGCGMDEEIKQNIFVPFFSTRKTLGTGLGLALTARIINVHGGTITVESEPDQGAAFRIHLPIDGPKDDREAIDGQAGSRS